MWSCCLLFSHFTIVHSYKVHWIWCEGGLPCKRFNISQLYRFLFPVGVPVPHLSFKIHPEWKGLHSSEWKDGSFSQTVGKVTQWWDGQHGQVSAYMCIWLWSEGQHACMHGKVCILSAWDSGKRFHLNFLEFAFALYQVSGKGDVDRKHGLLMRNNHKVAAKSKNLYLKASSSLQWSRFPLTNHFLSSRDFTQMNELCEKVRHLFCHLFRWDLIHRCRCGDWCCL